ncbi:MAG: spore protease YyaC [Peptococcia bacterium]
MGYFSKLLLRNSNYDPSTKLSVHMDDRRAALRLSEYLSNSLLNMEKKGPPIILCIGTDRSTGDSLGPLTGMQLNTLLKHWNLSLYGSLEEPVHALNLTETIQSFSPEEKGRPLIAIDACLGKTSPVGSIIAQREPLLPGIGLKKNLPAVGDISISGIVNMGGFMELQVLQNTRLNLVFKMAKIIAQGVYWSIQRTYPQLRKY